MLNALLFVEVLKVTGCASLFPPPTFLAEEPSGVLTFTGI